jgi:siroheme synthase (precorrin-2 oxidase/ferrochelatase)
MSYDNWKTRSPDDERDDHELRDDHEPPAVAELLNKLRQAPQPDDVKTTAAASTEVLAHLEEVAEQAIMAQCAQVRELIDEAQSLDNLLVADLARIKETLHIGISTGARAAELAREIGDTLRQLKAKHADVQVRT